MVRMTVTTVLFASFLNASGLLPLNTAPLAAAAPPSRVSEARAGAIARAHVWMPTDISSLDIKAGPKEPGAFPFHATVHCEYVQREMSGASPKFACRTEANDELKVKFGGTNAEVYGEVAATRLLWALGFGADRMYPVRVICRGCPREFAGIARENDEWVFDPASIERKAPGAEFPGDEGWSWEELADIDSGAGGAPRAHVDALKLLAVFLQHTDTKPVQQRLICRDQSDSEFKGLKPDAVPCAKPYMMLNDVGQTFGKANMFNANEKAMNLVEWAQTPVWKDARACVGNLSKSMTGTLKDPVISEEGRRFLAGLLTQLTDAQISDLFEISRVTLRLRSPEKARSGFATVQEWADVFKQKRSEIVNHRCA
jgi:hypothetical protein